jgi:hypothetical protein
MGWHYDSDAIQYITRICESDAGAATPEAAVGILKLVRECLSRVGGVKESRRI